MLLLERISWPEKLLQPRCLWSVPSIETLTHVCCMTAVLFLPWRSGAASAKGMSNFRSFRGGLGGGSLLGLCWCSRFVFFQIYDLCSRLAGAGVITAYTLIYTSLLIIWGGSAACWCQYIPPRLGPVREEPTLPLSSLSCSLSRCLWLKLESTATVAASHSFSTRRRQMSLTLPLTAGLKSRFHGSLRWTPICIATTACNSVPLPQRIYSSYPASSPLWNYIGQVSFQQQATRLAALFSIPFISAALDLKNLLGPLVGS